MFIISNYRSSLAVGLGAIAGALTREYIGQWIISISNLDFPIHTYLINISGCFFIGLVVSLVQKKRMSNPELLLGITTGFLGAYTTFSTYELETFKLLTTQGLFADLIYWIGSAVFGLLACLTGIFCLNKLI